MEERDKVCRICARHYLDVDWLPYRVVGFCSKKCQKDDEESTKRAKKYIEQQNERHAT